MEGRTVIIYVCKNVFDVFKYICMFVSTVCVFVDIYIFAGMCIGPTANGFVHAYINTCLCGYIFS